jgi:hypothetical protein
MSLKGHEFALLRDLSGFASRPLRQKAFPTNAARIGKLESA